MILATKKNGRKWKRKTKALERRKKQGKGNFSIGKKIQAEGGGGRLCSKIY